MSNDVQKIKTDESLINPSAQAQVNQMITAAVKEMFQQMAPVLQSIALTPDKIREANKPWVDPAVAARELRERKLMREDLADSERQRKEFQSKCSHKDANGRWAMSTIHNYPDRNPRLICVHCHRFIQPTHWEIWAPDNENPRGKPVLVKADADYARILADVAEQAQTV